MKNKAKDLNYYYKNAYMNILRNLNSQHISYRVYQEIIDDVLALALDNQQRGLSVQEAFGDLEEFCNQISENAVKETMFERCMRLFYIFSIGIFVVFITTLLLAILGLDTTISLSQYTMIISSRSFLMTIAIYTGILLANYAQGRTIFRLKEYSWIIYTIVYASCYIGMMVWVETHEDTSIILSFLTVFLILCIAGVISLIYQVLTRKQYKKYKGL